MGIVTKGYYDPVAQKLRLSRHVTFWEASPYGSSLVISAFKPAFWRASLSSAFLAFFFDSDLAGTKPSVLDFPPRPACLWLAESMYVARSYARLKG